MSSFFFILFVAIRVAFLSPFIVDGHSMEPTLYNKEFFIIENNLESSDELERGDIVVFSFDDDFFYVKRIIGLPGDKLRIGGSHVEIKGGQEDSYRILHEPYLMGENVAYGDERYFIVPEGEFFVMGDNRAHSKDSRTFRDPYVPFGDIDGRKVYP